MMWTGESNLRKIGLVIVFLLGVMGCGRPGEEQQLPTRIPTAVVPTPVATASPLPWPTIETQQFTAVSPTTSPPSPTPLMQRLPSLAATHTATPSATPLPTTTPVMGESLEIGKSVQGRPIVVYKFNDGPNHIIFVGGIHGGYEWNTIIVAYAAIDYFTAHPQLVPENVTLHIIPSANPDGQFLVTQREGRFTAADVPPQTAADVPPQTAADVPSQTIPGRFNANGVDLNRNWDCEWAETAVWQDKTVSGGERPFSEPENILLRDYILAQNPTLVIFWHSAANGVFAAGCPGTDPLSLELATVYGQAAGYPIYEQFNSYPITGDAGDWLTSQGIPSISIELTTHEAIDWPQNLAGMLAVLRH